MFVLILYSGARLKINGVKHEAIIIIIRVNKKTKKHTDILGTKHITVF